MCGVASGSIPPKTFGRTFGAMPKVLSLIRASEAIRKLLTKLDKMSSWRGNGHRLPDAAAESPKLSLEQANRIFAYLDTVSPSWMKPRTAMFLHHFLPCVEAKIDLSNTHG